MLQLSLDSLSELNFMAYNLKRGVFQKYCKFLNNFKNISAFFNFLKIKDDIAN